MNTLTIVALVAFVLLVLGGVWWLAFQPEFGHFTELSTATPSEPLTAPAQPHHVTCILYGADGLHSTTHRAGTTHPPILIRPHGTKPATTYALAEVRGSVGVYQEEASGRGR